jgi:hypothetical protein
VVLPLFVLGWMAIASSNAPETPDPALALGPPGNVVIPDQLIPGKQWDEPAPAAPALAAVDIKPAKKEEPAAKVLAAPKKVEQQCETFGTEVEFARNPAEAARMAREERKLTFVLHVSGNFEEAKFT